MKFREYVEWIRNNNAIASQKVGDIFKTLLRDYDHAILAEIDDAYEYANKMHAGQKRSDGQVYIIHPVRVASLYLLSCDAGFKGAIVEGIIAALLHDVYEDSGVPIQFIRERYGVVVSKKIEMLSTKKKDSENKVERMHRKTEKWKRMLNIDKDTLTIHACDVCDNAISWRNLNVDYPKLSRWIFQAEKYQVPLLEERLPQFADVLKEEIDFEYERGAVCGDWYDA